jgi:membrane-associated phospholipid phosphatase
MLLTWFLGGFAGAYVFASAGPVFIHLADPQLASRFSELRDALGAGLSEHSSVRLTQAYLSSVMSSHKAVFGGGISAMPSMHIGAVSIMVLAARGTPWLVPAVALWIAIFIGSAYFGYHYWLDGIVAAGIAWCCWIIAEKIYAPNAARPARMLPQLT